LADVDKIDLTSWSDDQLDRFLTACESRIGMLRIFQCKVLREVDRRQTPLADGCRSLGEWVTGRLDVAPDTANTLVATAKRLESLPVIEAAAGDGELSYDRTAAVARLATSSDLDESAALHEAAGWDVAGIHAQVAQRNRLSSSAEQDLFRDQYVATQLNLDHTALRFHGQLVGVAAPLFEEALHTVGDQLPDNPEQCSRATRNAHALAKISQDALDGGGAAAQPLTPQVTVFIDATTAAATCGEAGVVIAAGPRVGPNTLAAILCDGVIEVTATTTGGVPVNLGRHSRVVSPQLRRYVIHRDGGVCTAEGCTSRYRLQVHHITPWSQGGPTDADNLTTLCWYHHHVVVHGSGYRIDPHSPSQRRRFLHPTRDPP
jgi:Domain of unknown function (DUF222)/HNH endonuclease